MNIRAKNPTITLSEDELKAAVKCLLRTDCGVMPHNIVDIDFWHGSDGFQCVVETTDIQIAVPFVK